MATIQVKFDDLDFTETVVNWEDQAPMRLDAQEQPKRHGAILASQPVLSARRIVIRGLVQEQDKDILRTTLDNMNKVFHRPNKKLRLYDDRYMWAYLSDFAFAFVEGSAGASAAYTATFICADPFIYSDTGGSDGPRTINSSDTPVDITNGNIYKEAFTINNSGSSFVYPTYNFVALGAVTRIVVRNLTTGKTFTYTGTLALNDTLVVNAGTLSVKKNGVEDLTNWNGVFVWLDPGDNSMEVEGTVSFTVSMSWSPRSY